MSEMNTNYNFTNEKFTINPDVYFTVDTTVINGHRICQLKSLKIYYHGESFEMKSGEIIHKYIIEKGILSIFSVELINYLNILINHENLYDIYSNDLKLDEYCLNSSSSRPGGRNSQQEISSFILHDKSNDINSNRYKEGLISDSHFVKSELNKLRNPNYPLCYSKYEDIKNIPIYCYVHPSLAINQGNTVILCHIGYILEKLANYKRFPEFNTQAVVSFLNIVSESARTDKTVEKINNLNLEFENEKLQKKYLKKKNKCKSLKKELEEIKQLMRNVNQSNLDMKSEIINQNNQISNQTNEITGLRQEVSDLNYTNKDLSQRIEKILLNSCVMANSVVESHEEIIKKVDKTLPKNYIPTFTTQEVFILINRKSLNEEIRSTYKLNENYIVLDSISCQLRDKEQHLKDHKYNKKEDEIIFESEHSNSLDFNKFVQNHGDIIVPLSRWIKTPDYRRKFIVSVSKLDELLTELDKLINESNQSRNEILISNQKLINSINQPLINISESIPEDILDSKIDISSMLNRIREDIKNNNEKLNQKIEDSKLEINQKIEDSKLELIEIMKNPATVDDLKLISDKPRLFILINRRYREIFPQDNGTFIYYTRIKDGNPVDPQILTIEDLMKFRIKDSSKIYEASDIKKKIIEKYTS